MARGGIGVLPHDEHPYIGQRPLECSQHVFARWQVAPPGIDLRAQELAHRVHLGFYGSQGLGPIGSDQLGERLR